MKLTSQLLASGAVAAFAPLALARPNEPAAVIRADVIQSHVNVLAAPEMRGRGSGDKGNEQAARYIAEHFRKAGLKPLGTSRQGSLTANLDGSGYYQPFSFAAGSARGDGNRLEANVGGRKQTYRSGTQFSPSALSAAGEARGELVFAGYGIRSTDPARDDYAGVDVRDKIVLVIAGTPDTDPHSPLFRFSGSLPKAMIARDRGAKALVVVLPTDTDVASAWSDANTEDAGIPIMLVRRDVAADWIRAAGRSETEANRLLSFGGPALRTGVQVSVKTAVTKVRKTTANILGLLEGSDPTLKNEVLVIGAHMDHVGMGGPGSLAEDKKPATHHGADDNASGTAGVLALADYFSQSSTRPKRSILFMAFSGEELGLLGSAHYVKNPVLPIQSTVAMLNMDMIGRMQGDRLIIGGLGTSPAWKPMLEELTPSLSIQMAPSDSAFGASDQQSFYLAKMPVLFFFTGLHADYHKPSDTAEKVNAAGTARIVQLVAGCAERIGNMPARPEFKELAPANSDSGQVRFRVSLGSIPDYAFDGEGVRLSGVRPGSPGDKAGLKEGDIIVKFGGRTIRSVQEYTVALGEHKPGDEVEIVVKRGAETVTVKAILAGTR